MPASEKTIRFPKLLGPGARVALVAPAGPVRDASDVERAEASARRMGWEPIVGEHVRDRDGYLAGADADRAADFNRAASDPAIDAVWCVRGGYGAMRLLDDLDYSAWQRHPKTLIGYSDITALHAAIGRRANLVTFHGPTARQEASAFSESSLRRAVVEGANPCGTAPGAITLVGGRASGHLVGGNLALLAALCGTPYAPRFDGGILVLEDVNEAVYRVDRMLTQLHLSGALAGLAGLAIGQFTEVPPDEANEARPVLRVLTELAERLRVPALTGLPVGHIDDQWTIPLGAHAELDADAKTLGVIRVTS